MFALTFSTVMLKSWDTTALRNGLWIPWEQHILAWVTSSIFPYQGKSYSLRKAVNQITCSFFSLRLVGHIHLRIDCGLQAWACLEYSTAHSIRGESQKAFLFSSAFSTMIFLYLSSMSSFFWETRVGGNPKKMASVDITLFLWGPYKFQNCHLYSLYTSE